MCKIGLFQLSTCSFSYCPHFEPAPRSYWDKALDAERETSPALHAPVISSPAPSSYEIKHDCTGARNPPPTYPRTAMGFLAAPIIASSESLRRHCSKWRWLFVGAGQQTTPIHILLYRPQTAAISNPRFSFFWNKAWLSGWEIHRRPSRCRHFEPRPSLSWDKESIAGARNPPLTYHKTAMGFLAAPIITTTQACAGPDPNEDDHWQASNAANNIR